MTNFYIILLLMTKVFFWSPFLVEGQSMDTTLHDHELVLIDRHVQPEQLKRGTVVVFSLGDDYYYIKRIIGLPGETVRINADGVAVKKGDEDFQLLSEPYLMDQKANYGDERFYIVPEGEYFMLGDNRNHSKDSRFFPYPYVKLAQIYGRYIYP